MAPQPPLSRSKSFREQMEEEGVDLDELYNVDSVVEEEAERGAGEENQPSRLLALSGVAVCFRACVRRGGG